MEVTASPPVRHGLFTYRLVVRRTQVLDGRQQPLFADWRHHAFVTNLPGGPVDLDADHRRHAVVELAIRDLKEGSGLSHWPSGKIWANAAWAVLAAIAHNLLRWTAHLGLGIAGPVVDKTVRRQLLTVPGRITTTARRITLHLPTRWPWADDWLFALHRTRALPNLC